MHVIVRPYIPDFTTKRAHNQYHNFNRSFALKLYIDVFLSMCSTSVKHDLPNICHHLIISECDDHDKTASNCSARRGCEDPRSGLEVANVKNLQCILHEDIMLNDRHDSKR